MSSRSPYLVDPKLELIQFRSVPEDIASPESASDASDSSDSSFNSDENVS